MNGEARETCAQTLAELCKMLGYRSERIATAVNGDFVAAGRRGSVALKENDKIEIVAPRQGG